MPGLIKPKQSRALKSARPKRRRKKVSHETKQEASKQEGEKSNPSMRASINRPPTPNQEEEPQKELSLREIINVKLVESGEKEKLMELLRERLVECGWRDEMKALCRAYARKKGRNNVTVDDLIHVITPKGRASVPDSVKAELLQRIRSFLMSSSLR
ncbi:hypothetical protein E2562_036196 [Oryza meyeriana var. granulata]|uniref:Transcription and mRNA export factor ENY2 n=1 Tax=Oryza meyeriana var. granulata TaxID=110450 RepID=A0A6G1ET12_9ORYZ|nr:hypothetical protein E2562_036196 [Oryza meyeriana var. granulata]